MENVSVALEVPLSVDCGYTYEPLLCFGSNIRKIIIPLQTRFFLYKMGFMGYKFYGHVFLMYEYWVYNILFRRPLLS